MLYNSVSMNIIKKSKSLLPIVLAGVIVGAYFLYNAAISSAAINDCLTTSGNLIQNCSFENPTTLPAGYIKHSTGHIVFPNGYTGLSGWTMVAPIKASNVGYFLPGFPAPSGTKILDLSGFVDMYNPGMNGEQAGAGVEQTVSGLAVGQTYLLTFSQGYLAPFASEIAVSINGISQGIFDLDATTAGSTNIGGVLWKDQTIKFTATSSSATIRFIHNIPQPGGKIVIYGSALDNVRLTLVPSTRTPVIDQVVQITTPTINSVDQVQNHQVETLDQNSVQTTTCSGMAAVAKLSDKEVFDLASNKKIGQCTISDLRGTSSYCDYYVNSAVVGKLGATGYPKNPASGDSTGCVVAPTLPKGVNTCWGGYDKDTMCTVDYVKNAANQIRKAIADNACGCTAPTTTTTTPTPTVNTVITKVSIRSNNRDVTFATTNNVVTLNYTLSEIPRTNKVMISEQSVTPVCSGSAPMYQCSAAIIVTRDIPMTDGLVSFTISTVGTTRNSTTATTDGSYVIVKRGTTGGVALPPIEHVPPVIGVPDTTSNPTVITGTCTKDVVINGTGFTPRLGTAICVDGTFNFPVIVTGDPVFTTTPIEVSGHTAFNEGIKNPPKEDVAPVVTTDTVTTTFTSPIANPITTTSSPAGTVVNTAVSNSVWGTPETANGLPNKCIPYFTQYLIKGDRDGAKGIKEVSKIQKFLNQYMGISIPTDGTFDSFTDAAVKSFQGKYVPNIIVPWEISGPTGWWYQSTRSYANYLTGCSEGVVKLDNGVKILDGQIVN